MTNWLLDIRVAISNGLCSLAIWADERGHPAADRRIIRFRSALDRLVCRLMGHPRIVYGTTRDICLDCLTIVDEHPAGRGRKAEP